MNESVYTYSFMFYRRDDRELDEDSHTSQSIFSEGDSLHPTVIYLVIQVFFMLFLFDKGIYHKIDIFLL